MKFVTENGYAFQLGDGSASFGVVHVSDLASFFVLLTEKVIDDEGKDIPRGKEGILFPQVGVVKSIEIPSGCLDAAFRQGILPKPNGPPERELRKVELGEISACYGGGEFGDLIASVIWAGHMNTTSSIAAKLGWEPQYSLSDWKGKAHWDAELQAFLDGRI